MTKEEKENLVKLAKQMARTFIDELTERERLLENRRVEASMNIANFSRIKQNEGFDEKTFSETKRAIELKWRKIEGKLDEMFNRGNNETREINVVKEAIRLEMSEIFKKEPIIEIKKEIPQINGLLH